MPVRDKTPSPTDRQPGDEDMDVGHDNNAGQPTPPPGGGGDGNPPSNDPTAVLMHLLGASLERQIDASLETSRRVERLGDRMESSMSGMGAAIGSEIREGMHRQNRIALALIGLAIVILGGAAGVTFMGVSTPQGYTIEAGPND